MSGIRQALLDKWKVEYVHPRKEDTYHCSRWLTEVTFTAEQLFLNRGLSCQLCFKRKPAISCLHPTLNCLPALCSCHRARPYKGAPGILFQLIGLRLSPSNRSCAAIFPSASSLTNQRGSILTNQEVLFRAIKLQGFGVLMSMRMD